MSSASRKLIQASGAVAGPADTGDDDFANVVLLLDGDGTSGDDNNTFTDSSTNGFTVTENGSVVQGSFSPYGDNWSNYFDTSGDTLTVPYNSTLAMGTGDCTIEAWVYFDSYPQAFSNIIDTRASGSYGSDAISFGVENDGNFNFYAGSYSSVAPVVETASGTVTLNSWYHLVLTRSSGTTKLYVNGVEEASSTNAWNQTSGSSTNLYIAGAAGVTRQVNGYISNLRLVKGTAVYTSAFTPSTAPLTAVSGTSLLTCQSNRFVDNSSNSYSITPNGDAKVTPFSPFKDDDARDITTDGGSGYKGGSSTSDYLVTQDALSISDSSNWTAECWVYLSTNSTRQNFFLVADAGETVGNQKDFQFEVSTSGKLTVRGGNGTSTFAISETNDAILGAWTHIAAVQNSGTITFYVNGSSVGTASLTPASIGGTRPAFLFRNSAATSPMVDGYIADARIVVGSSVYTTAFTPPTSPLTAVTNTELLLNFQDAGIYDRTGLNNLDTVGNAQIDTAVKKYGTGSLEFDGTGDGLYVPSDASHQFGTGDFTVEFWVNMNSNSTDYTFVGRATPSSTFDFFIQYRPSVSNNLKVNTVQPYAPYDFSWTPSANQWYHIAVTRSGTNLRAFVDGVQIGTTQTDSSNINADIPLAIGYNLESSIQYLNGYIDDLRITKGIARYTANFTAPDAALPKF